MAIKLPCGQCLSCRIAKAQDWGVRASHEMRYHRENTAFTLTYAPEHLPEHGFLNHADVQAFMKRVRKHRPEVKIRYLMSGEYGSQTKRPHYHFILFGTDFPDKLPSKKSPSGHMLYRSEELNRLWGKGHALISDANQAVAEYLAKYTAKRSSDLGAIDEYSRVDLSTGEVLQAPPEYIRASNGGGRYAKDKSEGGLGSRFAHEHIDQIYAFDNVVVNNHERRVPRYYDKLLDRIDSERLAAIKATRKENALKHQADQTPERLKVKARAKLKQYKIRERGKFKESA